MHPRNRYRDNPADFGELAEFRPSLKPYLIEKHKGKATPTTELFPHTLDFSDPAALRELTCAVLEKDFDLKLEIPVDTLIPTVPQKLNYIHWVEDLLSCGGVASHEGGVASKELVLKGKDIVGIDIGRFLAIKVRATVCAHHQFSKLTNRNLARSRKQVC